ncbi:hypothetical protein [Paenibacillus whitsoniae]|uniref:Uncharacterized protein n=1 Tax=Paenibacillus whitsoniae TaxID=2496558 RepID=A0A430J7E9_9BACL|nr:hypothetical protein [Paenibacillus whitsoniae]RTE05475.1 hypothetical protein EJQ19_24945 [Paenibacillus whitsoniae]
MNFKPEELTLIKESVLLPFLLPIVDRNLREMEEDKNGGAFMRQLYISSGNLLYREIESDIRKIKQTLRSTGIRVWENESKRDNQTRYYSYSRGGYEGELTILRNLVRGEIAARLKGYMNRLEQSLRAVK